MRTPTPGCDPDRLRAADDNWLRGALTVLRSVAHWPGHPTWEAVGTRVLHFAARDSSRHGRFAEDYRDAYLEAAISHLSLAPDAVIAADSPWGSVLHRARFAGETAIGEALSGGLHARDPIRHRTKLRDVPTVVGFDPTVYTTDPATRP
jgi:hypothetical protein